MFGIDLISMLKSDLLKYKDKAGNPIAVDALNGLEKGVVILNNFVAKLTPADVQAVLALLPPEVSAKFSPSELLAVANAIANLPTQLQGVEALITNAVAKLQAK
jgi:hypothetical protein